jgi:hypothetical protein
MPDEPKSVSCYERYGIHKQTHEEHEAMASRKTSQGEFLMQCVDSGPAPSWLGYGNGDPYGMPDVVMKYPDGSIGIKIRASKEGKSGEGFSRFCGFDDIEHMERTLVAIRRAKEAGVFDK